MAMALMWMQMCCAKCWASAVEPRLVDACRLMRGWRALAELLHDRRRLTLLLKWRPVDGKPNQIVLGRRD